MSKLISVVIPVYNAETSLKRSIESVLNQTYSNIELIIVNDGSSDGSEKICLSYDDRRINYIYQKNEGVAAARNNALKVSKGDYIAFLDADDYLDPYFCEKLLFVLENQNADMSICMNCKVHQKLGSEGNIEEYIKKPKIRIREVFSIASEEYDFYDRHSHWTVWGALYKKSLLDGIKFRKGLYVGEDTYYLAEVIKKAQRIAFLDEYLIYYIYAIDSASHGKFDSKKYTELESWKKIVKLYEDRPEQVKNIKATYAKRCMKMIKTYYPVSEEFRKDYYKQTIREYRKNARLVLNEDKKKKEWIFFIKHIIAYVIPKIAFKKQWNMW
ncbi:MAG: glycosyltransferase [Ruminococcus flavefaciens]|nr:glycosyltransferase [Ruminococcus flavefaciens]MCM1362976.1 glycosyltransferase [Clostridiales bacterium]